MSLEFANRLMIKIMTPVKTTWDATVLLQIAK